MARSVAIPGRRVSGKEVFTTDWVQRGGDCVILRVEVLWSVGGEAISFELETRGEDGSAITEMIPTSPTGGLQLISVGVGTCLYLASTSGTAGNGSQEQVRVRVTGASSASSYHVVRILPLIFFESAKSY